MRTVACILLLLSASCTSFFGLGRDRGVAGSEAVSDRIDRAERLLAEGLHEESVKLLIPIQNADDLDTVTRHKVELLLERGAIQWLEAMLEANATHRELEDLFKKKVPRRARVSAGIAAARRRLQDDEPLEAYSMVRRVEEKFPSHHERAAAGNVLADAGFRLARSEEKYFLFFEYRERAPEVLEYLVLNHPSNPSCEEAYLVLASLYEEEGRLALAQERHEDLLLFHPASAFAPYSESMIPALRIRRVRGPEYDRSELELAREELERWLVRHPGDDRGSEVRRTLVECKRLLVTSDLEVAGFYDRVGKDFGVRMHGGRSLELAREVGDTGLAERAQRLLSRIGVEEETP